MRLFSRTVWGSEYVEFDVYVTLLLEQIRLFANPGDPGRCPGQSQEG